MARKVTQTAKPLILKEWAYEWIKERILNSTFVPGSLLKIEEISRKLEISRTPIREAFLRLEQEGLIYTRPRVGSFVAEISGRELEHLLEVRALLEGFAVRSLEGVLTEDELDELCQLLSTCEIAVQAGNLDAFEDHDINFHKFLMERAPNPWIGKIMGSIENLMLRKRSIAADNYDHVVASLAEHRAIYEALKRGSGQQASELMGAHLHAIEDRLRIIDSD